MIRQVIFLMKIIVQLLVIVICIIILVHEYKPYIKEESNSISLEKISNIV